MPMILSPTETAPRSAGQKSSQSIEESASIIGFRSTVFGLSAMFAAHDPYR